MNNDQTSPDWWIWGDDEPEPEPRHACWSIVFADGREQRIGVWPPLTRDEVLAAYRCTDAQPD